jgi:hypothetical protein
MTTNFSNKCKILSEFYSTYRDDKDMEEFMAFNDIGLPLAYLFHEELVTIKPEGNRYIEETWKIFIASLGLEDTGFEDINQVMTEAEKNQQ